MKVVEEKSYKDLLVKMTGDDEATVDSVLSRINLEDLKAIVDAVTSGDTMDMANGELLYKKWKSKIGESFKGGEMNTSNIWLKVKNGYKTGGLNSVKEALQDVSEDAWASVWPKMGKAMLLDLFAKAQGRKVAMEDYDYSEQVLAEAFYTFVNGGAVATKKPFTTPVELVEGLIDRDDLVRQGYTHYITLEGTAGDNLMDYLEENSIDYLVDLDGNFSIKMTSDQFEAVEGFLSNVLSEATDEGNINAPKWTTDSQGQYKGSPMQTDYGLHKVDMGEPMPNSTTLGGQHVDSLLDDDLFAVDVDGTVKNEKPAFVKTGDMETQTGTTNDQEGLVQMGSEGSEKNDGSSSNPAPEKAAEPKEDEVKSEPVKSEPKAVPFTKKEEAPKAEEPKEEKSEEPKEETEEEKKKKVDESIGNILKNAGILTEGKTVTKRNPVAKDMADNPGKYRTRVEKSKDEKEKQSDNWDRKAKYKGKEVEESVVEDFHVGDKVMVGEDEGAVKIPNGPAGTIGVVVNGEMRMVEAKDVKRLDESLIGGGMISVPSINRIRELAGLKSGTVKQEAKEIVKEFSEVEEVPDMTGDDVSTVPTDDLDADINSGMDAGMAVDDYEPLPSELEVGGDDMGDLPAELPMDDGMGEPEMAPDAGIPGAVGTAPVMAAPMAPTQSDAFAQIEDHLNNIQNSLSDIRLSEYKTLVKKLNDLANQVSLMGRDYLGESVDLEEGKTMDAIKSAFKRMWFGTDEENWAEENTKKAFGEYKKLVNSGKTSAEASKIVKGKFK